MRSMFIIAASAAVLSFAPQVSHANDMSFGLTGGVSIPIGDYGDAFGIGAMGGVYGDMAVTPAIMLGLDVNGNFHGISSDLEDQFKNAGLANPDLSFTVIEFGLHGKWRPGSGEGPYAQAGVGIYNGRTKFEFEGFSSEDSESKFGFSVGAGFGFWHSESMTLGVQGMFHNVTDAIEEFDPATGSPTGNTKSAQYVSIGLNLGFVTSHPGSSTH